MRDGVSAMGDGLPADFRPVFDAYAERGDWVGALTLLLTEGERRSDMGERVACYLRAARLYEQQFANSAEAQSILEYVLGLSPDEPEATLKLRALYTRARRQDKLRWLASDRQKLGTGGPVPRPPGLHLAAFASSKSGADSEGAGGLAARLAAATLLVALPASVVAANMRAVAVVEPHDNGGGALGWLLFASLDLAFCTVFVAFTWLPARWALRRVWQSALLGMLALLSATFLVALVPTLGWNAIDAANVLLDPNAPSAVTVRVVDHAPGRKSAGPFSVVQEGSARSGSMKLVWSLGAEPIGSEHELRRGDGFFRRMYYLRPQKTAH